MAESSVPAQTLNDFDNITASFELDLTALFTNMRDDMIDLTNKAVNEGWTEDEFIDAVVGLI